MLILTRAVRQSVTAYSNALQINDSSIPVETVKSSPYFYRLVTFSSFGDIFIYSIVCHIAMIIILIIDRQ